MWSMFIAQGHTSGLVNSEVRRTRKWNSLEGKGNNPVLQNLRMVN